MALSTVVISREDQEVIQKTKAVCRYFNGFLYKAAHEPTLASYRIQEHVHKAAPALANEQYELEKLNSKLSGAIFDLDYTLSILDKMTEADTIFCNIKEILRNTCRSLLSIHKK